MFYVYKLIDPRDGKTFYVGKGKGKRMYKHEQYTLSGKRPNGNKNLYDRILDIKSNDFDIIYEKFYETENENLAYIVENDLINEIGIENLCNVISHKILIGIANNTKNKKWYFNSFTEEYRLFGENDEIPKGFTKGSPRTKSAMEKWWLSLDDKQLEEYKRKMSNSIKNSEKHKKSVSSLEYKKQISDALKKSDKFQEYNKNRTKRGKYKESQKNIVRRKTSFLINDDGHIVKKFTSLSEVCEFFGIKTSTASTWIKNERRINDLTIKSE